MKKLLYIILLLGFILPLFACGKSEQEIEEERRKQQELEEQKHQQQIQEDMLLVSINDLTVSYDGNEYTISVEGLKDEYEAKLDESLKLYHSYPGEYEYKYQIFEKGKEEVLKTLEASLVIEIEVKEFHTETQLNVINNPYAQATIYAKGTEELSIPNPITLEFNEEGIVKLFKENDLENATLLNTIDCKVEIYNLYVNTIYGYTFNDGEVIYFMTAKEPRNLNMDGLTNVRDLGGWKIGENTFVKQGMILRTSKLNEDESSQLVITEAGIQLFLDMGIKTEIDLRRIDNNESGSIELSPLGDTVNYIALPMKSGGNIITLNKEQFITLFEILAEESNYPLIFHCSIGTDRTGCVAFLINGLLGVDQDDLYHDYMFSNLGLIGRMRTPTIIDDYIRTVKYSGGDTLKEQIYNYLISIGVSQENLDKTIELLSETIER